MDCRGVLRRATSLSIVLLGTMAPATMAGAINFTGNVENDFVVKPDYSVVVVPGSPVTGVGQSDFITKSGWINGWVTKDLRLAYNQATDTMQVGVNFYGIAGDSDGNGDPGTADPRTRSAGGIDLPYLGGRKSIAVAFAGNGQDGITLGTPRIIAGVPADKSVAGPGLDGFTVSTYKSGGGLAYSFGSNLAANQGDLAFNPSKDHPDFEFTVKNFSKITGLDPKAGFWAHTFAGSPDDVVAGEDSIPWVRIPQFSQQQVPEPSTLLAWSMIAGGAAWGLRRSRHSTNHM